MYTLDKLRVALRHRSPLRQIGPVVLRAVGAHRGWQTLRHVLAVGLLLGLLMAESPNAGQASPAMPVPAELSSHELDLAATAPRRLVLEGSSSGPLGLPEYAFERQPLRRIHRVTAYCDRGLTAAGIPSGVGQCAAPADIPFGSVVYIPALGRTFVVTDRTAERFRRNTIDIFVPGRQACRLFGLNWLECDIYVPRHQHRYGSTDLLDAVAAFAR